VIISLGADGLIVGSPQAEHKLESYPVTPVDTVGAGDALIAGLAVALGEGQGLLDAARFANAAAALVVTRKGTWQAMPTRKQVEDFLYEHESTKRSF
jgi:ribokinase